MPDFFDSIMTPVVKEIGNENLSLLKGLNNLKLRTIS